MFIKYLVLIFCLYCSLFSYSQEVLPGVDLVKSKESKVVMKFLSAYQPNGLKSSAKSYISPRYLSDRNFLAEKYQPNMYKPDRFTITQQQAKTVIAVIHSHDSYWAHKISFNVINEGEKFYILPSEKGEAQYGYFNPWVSIENDVNNEAKTLKYNEIMASGVTSKPVVTNISQPAKITEVVKATVISLINKSVNALNNESHQISMMQAMFHETLDLYEQDNSHRRAQRHSLKSIKYIKAYRNAGIINAKNYVLSAIKLADEKKCKSIARYLNFSKNYLVTAEELSRGLEKGIQYYSRMKTDDNWGGMIYTKEQRINYEFNTRSNDVNDSVSQYVDSLPSPKNIAECK